MNNWKFVVYLCLLYFSHADEDIANSTELEGPNVCKRIIPYNVTVVVTESVPYQEIRTEWCPQIRCRKTVIKFKTVNTTKVLEKARTIQECCDGYEKSTESNTCIPKTSIPLNKLCNAGWTGEFCNEPCTDNLWGANCLNICKCQNKSKCRKYDGRCLCELGFTGEFCEQKCAEGFYGNDCIEACNCPNIQNFQCHHAYGCICADGFTGLSCEELNDQK